MPNYFALTLFYVRTAVAVLDLGNFKIKTCFWVDTFVNLPNNMGMYFVYLYVIVWYAMELWCDWASNDSFKFKWVLVFTVSFLYDRKQHICAPLSWNDFKVIFLMQTLCIFISGNNWFQKWNHRKKNLRSFLGHRGWSLEFYWN